MTRSPIRPNMLGATPASGMCVSFAGVLHNLHTGCVSINGSSAFLQRTVVTREDETVAPFPELDCPATKPLRTPRVNQFLAPIESLPSPDAPVRDLDGRYFERINVQIRSGYWSGRSIPKKLSPLEDGLPCQQIIFWVGGAGPINLRPVFSTPAQAADEESPWRGSSGDGSRCDGSNAPIPRIASVQSGVIFHNSKFRLKIDPTSGCVSIPAAGLRPSQPLTSVSAAEPNFSCKVSSFPSSERWTSASTVPGAGFLGFISSTVGGAYDIRTDAVSPMNSSSVKLRHIPASVHFASPVCLAATVLQTSPTCRKRQRLLPGAGIHFSGRAAWPYKSGKQHILTLRRPVLLFDHNPKLFLAYSSSNPKPAPREHRRNQNQIRAGAKRLITFSPFFNSGKIVCSAYAASVFPFLFTTQYILL